MKYNPQIHHRRSIRLKGYDYSQAGAYFITICCQDRECRFGKIENDEMILNKYGQIAYDEWLKLPERFSNFELDVFQIMPNHMHGIIVLNDVMVNGQPQQKGQPQGIAPTVAESNVGAGFTPAHHTETIKTNATVGDIVGAYKSLVANGCLDIHKQKWAGVNRATARVTPTMGKIWQRNYHEHIIRNEQSNQTISNYIINNPSKWNDDKFYVGAGFTPAHSKNKTQ